MADAATRGEPLRGGIYRDMWVYCEQKDGEFLPVSLEMLGEARRLMDKYAQDYKERENVVAVVLGHSVDGLAKQAIQRGADVVYIGDHPELATFRLEPATRVVAGMARAKDANKAYDKPRYFLFPATHNGRDLSATVLAELESGLASDCNKLYIEDIPIKHPVKTPGGERIFERTLGMKRPDFSGFEWSTILCLNDPEKEFYPQACSVIPGSFQPLDTSTGRNGTVVPYKFNLGERDLRVKVRSRRKLGGGVRLDKFPVVVAVGRGIGANPSEGMRLGVELAKALGGEVGVSRGVVTAKYPLDANSKKYAEEERQIGETGQFVKPKVYLALGISGAIQHKKGMDQSEKIVAVNTDEAAPIREFSDVFVKGDLYKVVPPLLRAIEAELKTATAAPAAPIAGGKA